MEMSNRFDEDRHKMWHARAAHRKHVGPVSQLEEFTAESTTESTSVPANGSPISPVADVVSVVPVTERAIADVAADAPSPGIDGIPSSYSREDDWKSMRASSIFSRGASSGPPSISESVVSTNSELSIDEELAILWTALSALSTENVESLPLVHLWHDVAKHLKQEDIPNPLDLFAEHEAIMR